MTTEKKEEAVPDSNGDDFVKQFYLDKFTSTVFGVENPPQDWADIGFLVPHEFVRREEQAMLASIDKLVERAKDGSIQPWQAVYFCEWFIDIFEPNIHAHHDNEEAIYFPWIQTKVEIPEKKLSKGHKDLIESLDELGGLCAKVIAKKGVDCQDEIQQLHTKMHAFVEHMDSHLVEEERDIPPLLRVHFTEEEEKACVQKIIAKSGLLELRNEFPGILSAMKEWATPKYVEEFMATMPGPILHLLNNYYLPDFETYIKPKRDAPLMETKPKLSQKGCCGISFLCRCIC